MTGLLIILALVALIIYAFARVFRNRARANLQRMGVELPAELSRLPAARARGAAPSATPPPAAGPAPGTPRPANALSLHFLLIYDVAPDFIQRRAQHRDEHLALAWRAADAGELVLAGALEEPAEQAFLLFRGTRESAQRFAQADPYVRHGLVTRWQVRQWHTVAGASAALPVRPGR